MPDLNKVIAGLEHCRKHGTLGGNNCFGHYMWTDKFDITRLEEHHHDCPYGKCKTGCVVTLVEDAAELLKEYRSAKPLVDATTNVKYVPGSCEVELRRCCNTESPYNEDCYFYEEALDMGARIPCCSYGDGFNPISQCPYGCKHYLKNSDVYKLVMEQLKKKEETK